MNDIYLCTFFHRIIHLDFVSRRSTRYGIPDQFPEYPESGISRHRSEVPY